MHPCLDENCPGTCKLQHPTWLLDPPEWIHSKVLEGMLEFSMEEIRLHFLKSPANFFADWDSLFLNNYFLIYDKLNSMHKPISMSRRYFDLRRMNNPPMFDKSKFFEIKRRKSEKIEVEESILSYNERRNQGFGDRKKYSDDRKEYFDDKKKYSDDRQNFSERRNYEGRKDHYDGRKKYLDDRQKYLDDRQNFDGRKKFTNERQNFNDRQNFSDRQNFDGRKKFTDERQNFSDRQNFNDRKYENKKPYFDDKRRNFHDKTYYDSKEKNYYDNKERNFYENKEKKYYENKEKRNYYDKEKRSFKEKDFFYKKEDKKNDLMETKDDKIFKDFASEDELI